MQEHGQGWKRFFSKKKNPSKFLMNMWLVRALHLQLPTNERRGIAGAGLALEESNVK